MRLTHSFAWAFSKRCSWLAYHDQAFLQSNLAKLVRLIEMRPVNTPQSIGYLQGLPPFKPLGKEQHVSATRQCGSNPARRITPRHTQRRVRSANAESDLCLRRAIRSKVTVVYLKYLFLMDLSPDIPPRHSPPSPCGHPCDRGGGNHPKPGLASAPARSAQCGRPRGVRSDSLATRGVHRAGGLRLG